MMYQQVAPIEIYINNNNNNNLFSLICSYLPTIIIYICVCIHLSCVYVYFIDCYD